MGIHQIRSHQQGKSHVECMKALSKQQNSFVGNLLALKSKSWICRTICGTGKYHFSSTWSPVYTALIKHSKISTADLKPAEKSHFYIKKCCENGFGNISRRRGTTVTFIRLSRKQNACLQHILLESSAMFTTSFTHGCE